MTLPVPPGSTRYDHKGYVLIKVVDHPFMGTGWVRRNRLVLSEKLGRKLLKNEIAHHLNEIKDDDTPNNIELLTESEHNRLHRLGTVPWNKGGKQTEEHRRKIGEANSRRVWSQESRNKVSLFIQSRERNDKGELL